MSESLYATQIKLEQKKHLLHVGFSDGVQFTYTLAYLRAFSPAADMRDPSGEYRHKLITNIDTVGIQHIEPVGRYAIQLFFDDGHNTGIYSWEYLYQLGQEFENNWAIYQQRLQATQSEPSL